MTSPPESHGGLPRRGLLAAGAGAFLCTIGGERVLVANFYSPRKLTANLESRINWVWTDESADVHDVKLVSAPKGFKRFQTEPGSGGFAYSKALTKPGVYKFICTLHEEDNMRMTITVRH